MIRCTKCGTINAEGDIFCSKCASFLEWTGVKVDPSQLDVPGSDSAPRADQAGDGALPNAEAGPPSAPLAPPPAEPETPDSPPQAEQSDVVPVARAQEPAQLEESEPPVEPAHEPDEPATQYAGEQQAAEPEAESLPPTAEAIPSAAPPPGPTDQGVSSGQGVSSPFGGVMPPTAADVTEPAPAETAAPFATATPAVTAPIEPEPPAVAQEPPPAPAPAPPPAAPPEPATPPAAPAPPSYRFRAGSAAASQPVATPAASSPGPVVPAAAASAATQPYEPAPVKPGAAAPPARLPQAVAPEQPRSRQPTLTTPARPVAQPRQTLAVEPDVKPGDLICAVCGAGNSPERRFCRRCGNSLAAATVAVAAHVPWYRRLFRRGQPAVMVAGERPAYMGRKGRSAGWFLKRLLVLIVIVLLVAPVVGYFAIPSFHQQIDSLLGRGGQTLLLDQHPSTAALDKDINTFWLSDQASGHTLLTVNFGQTTDLSGMIFNSGASGTDYSNYGRPREVDLTFPGDPNVVQVQLNDSPAPQTRCLNPHKTVSTFNIQIVSSYPPQGTSQNLVALREVEFTAGSCSPS